MADALSDLLSRLASEGSKDSSGGFTVDLFGSHQRLRESLLENPAAWLLKVLQSAVAAGPDSIFVVQKRQDVQVKFELAAVDPVFDRLPEAFLNPLDAAWNPATRHLALGLHAAFGQAVEYVAWVRARRGKLGGFLVTPQGLRPLELEAGSPVEDACFVRVRKRSGGSWKSWLGLGPRRLNEAAAVARMAFSACPLYLDGLRILPGKVDTSPPTRSFLDMLPGYLGLVDRILVSREPLAGLISAPVRAPAVFDLGRAQKDLDTRGDVVLQQWRVPDHGQKLFPGGPPPGARIVVDERPFTLVGRPPGEYFFGHYPARGNANAIRSVYAQDTGSLNLGDRRYHLPAHAFLSLPCPCARQDGVLQLVVDGLALRPLTVDLGYPGAYALVADPQVQTDLSQMAPVEDAHYAELLGYLRHQFREMVKDVRPLVRFGDRLQVPSSQSKPLKALLQLEE